MKVDSDSDSDTVCDCNGYSTDTAFIITYHDKNNKLVRYVIWNNEKFELGKRIDSHRPPFPKVNIKEELNSASCSLL